MNIRNYKYYKRMIKLICVVFVLIVLGTVYLRLVDKEALFVRDSKIGMSNASDLNSTGNRLPTSPNNSTSSNSSSIFIPDLSQKKRDIQNLNNEMITLEPKLTTFNNKMTAYNPDLSTKNVGLTTVKTTLDTSMTILKQNVTTQNSNLIPVNKPTTFKYNFTLIHETWPTISFDAKIPKPKLKRYPSPNSKRSKIILTQPQVMPPPWSNSNASSRYIVYVCDGRNHCGGIGDRQRTIVSLYVLSRIVNRRFCVIMTSPCNITHFFAPFRYMWLPPPDLDPPSKNNTIYEMTTGTGLQFTKSLASGDFNAMYPQRVMYLITNIDMFEYFSINPGFSSVLQQWNGLLNKPGRFHWAWSELMQPTSTLMNEIVSIVGVNFLKKKGLLPANDQQETKVKSLYDVGNANLICAHVRVGKNPSNPHDEAFSAATIEDLPLVHNFMLSKDTTGDAMFYVASDYINARIISHNFFGKRFLEFGAKIRHIDRQRSGADACNGFKWSVLDQLILSLCDVLVMSPSGFSLGAYYTSNRTDATYILENGQINPYYE